MKPARSGAKLRATQKASSHEHSDSSSAARPRNSATAMEPKMMARISQSRAVSIIW
ncbi:hypothetical protein D3C71_1937460 [compost metagenome]